MRKIENVALVAAFTLLALAIVALAYAESPTCNVDHVNWYRTRQKGIVVERCFCLERGPSATWTCAWKELP